MDFMICDKWKMTCDQPRDGWFLDWALRSPKEVSAHLTAGHMVFSDLREAKGPMSVDSVVHYFGGLGAQALMVEDLFSPGWQAANDYSASAASHLKKTFPKMDISQMDSYISHTQADLQVLDFGDLTVWRTREGEKHRQLLDRVFADEPEAVVLTDIAGPRLHLQRERYETLLGAGNAKDYPTYLRALAVRFNDLYGYELLNCVYHRWSAVMSFIPPDEFRDSGKPFVQVPHDNKGFRVL